MPTNAKRIYNHAQKLVNYFPCGECFECRRQKTQDLMVRAYFEDDCKFTLFDTLTYSEKCVPWLKSTLLNEIKMDIDLNIEDMRIVLYDDYQKFMKRLRKNIQGYDVKIKYIVSAEYGTEEGRTHRPHFHCIFFVNGEIEPKELSRLIKKSWQFGITDGWQDKGLNYFNTKRIFNGYDAKYKVIGYLCKYVTKDNEYEQNVIERLRQAGKQIYAQLYRVNATRETKEYVSKILKKHKQFTKWSKGFGEKFIDEQNMMKFENMGYIQIRTDLNNKKYSLPLYYRRKMYNVIDKKTKEVRLNDNGIRYLETKLKNEYNNNLKRMQLYNDSDIENKVLAYYITYVKDRKKGDLLPDYGNIVALNENSIIDKYTYPKGNVLYDGKNYSTEEFIRISVKNNLEFDEILEKIFKKESEDKTKISVITEYNYKMKKNAKKMLNVI